MTASDTKNIFVINRQRLLKLNSDKIKLLARYVLKNENIGNDVGINLMFVRNNVIRKYNKDFLNKDNPTDVISFEGNINDGSAGDIIISVEKAVEYAAQNNIDVNEELARYVIHGVLHCLGYEDIIDKERRAMFKRQEELLEKWYSVIGNPIIQ
ncbi:rRNA maturation RNase YbeY [bacterium]|nr:rRNA maturation RNase YbeY [bacterium]